MKLKCGQLNVNPEKLIKVSELPAAAATAAAATATATAAASAEKKDKLFTLKAQVLCV
jgi:ribosomal protein L12E/L44/L45/RPP1/RPP2